jgi:general secretion pathway protein A
LKAILEDLGLEREGESEKELLERLNKFLIEELSKGGNVAVIIDESQDLTPSLLEEIRLLSNLETEKEKLLQIVLVGQLELHHKLNSPSLKQLNQRIAVRYHLTALNKSETVEYIYYRLKVAGSQGNIKFTPRALRRVYNYSQGTPRMINILADKALLAGYISETDRITSKIVKRAIKEIRGEELERRPFLLKELSRSLVFTLIILGIGLAWFLSALPRRQVGERQETERVAEETSLFLPASRVEAGKIETLTDLAKFWGGLLLCPGMADPPKVKKLQECLKKLGYYQGSLTDNFSEGTKKAVMNFQKDNQIKVDGLVGPETKAVLYYRLLSENEYYK